MIRVRTAIGPLAAALLITAPLAAAPLAAAPSAHDHTPGDPLEGVNRAIYGINQGLDRAIVRPLALGYRHVVPRPLRSGLRHFISNLTEPVVFLNDLLQLKPKHALRTFKRFLINSTIGIGGVIDVARHEGIPHRGNGFGNTLGRYGVKAGPYLYLPLLGPSTLRDAAGGGVDGLVLPTAIGHPFDQARYRIPATVINGLDQRARADADLKTLLDSALDPYATLRSVYLQSRAADVAALRGKTAAGVATDPLADPMADPAGEASAGAVPAALSDPLTDPAAPAAVTLPEPATAAPADDPFATPPPLPPAGTKAATPAPAR